MTSSIYHYTYLIEVVHSTHPTKRYYMGVRSSGCLPEDDVKYHGSSKDTELINLIRGESDNINKYILGVYDDRESAEQAEIAYHTKFNVAEHPLFWNKVNAGNVFRDSGDFERKVSVLDVYSGETYNVSVVDVGEHIPSGRFKGVYVSPWGNFSSSSRMADACPVHIVQPTCHRFCTSADTVKFTRKSVSLCEFLTVDHIGKTAKEVGFDFVEYVPGVNNELVADLLNVPSDTSARYIDDKVTKRKLIDRFNTTHVQVLRTPFGDASLSEFNRMGLGVLVTSVKNNTYNNVAKFLRVDEWKESGYEIVDAGSIVNDLRPLNVPSSVRTLIHLTSTLSKRGIRYSVFNGVYVQPDGNYASIPEILKKSVYGKQSQRLWSNLNKSIDARMVAFSSLLDHSHIGHTYRDLGFDFVEYVPGVNDECVMAML